jgi:hypothetical protein
VIQEAVSDELKKVQEEEFSAAFQKLYNRAKACMELILNFKKCVFLMCLRFKKNSPKTFGKHCVYEMVYELKIMYGIEMWGFSEAWKELDNVQTILQEIIGGPELTMEKQEQSKICLG